MAIFTRFSSAYPHVGKWSNYITPGIKVFLTFFLLFLFSDFKLTSQVLPGLAPVNTPTGGFAIEGDLKANTPTSGTGTLSWLAPNQGDWLSGPGGTGGFVLDGTPLGAPINPATTLHLYDKFDSNIDDNFS